MSNVLKKPYEISLWKDTLMYHILWTETESEEDVPVLPDISGYQVVYQYYKEDKVAVLGSDTNTAESSIFNPIFTQELNGSSTLQFELYYQYYSQQTGELIDNPFCKLLSNESKIKLWYDDGSDDLWHDYIIKEINESSQDHSFTYTCTDLFINELSKNGFSLEFDAELENNQGTIIELAEKVVAETDWEIDKANSDVLIQTFDEPLYLCTVKSGGLTAHDMETGDELILAEGTHIYVFYSVVNSDTDYIQFLYNANGYETDSDRIITNSPNYYIIANESPYENPYLVSDYRGRRIVRQQLGTVDPVMDQIVNVYYRMEDNEKVKYYGYSKYDPPLTSSVYPLISNGINFTSIDGWKNADDTVLAPKLFPEVNNDTIGNFENVTSKINASNFESWKSKLYIKVGDQYIPVSGSYSSTETYYARKFELIKSYLNANFGSNGWIINSGFKDNVALYSNLTKGEQFILRIKYSYLSGSTLVPVTTAAANDITAKLRIYTTDSAGQYSFPESYIIDGVDDTATLLSFSSFVAKDGYLEATATCTRSISYTNLRSALLKYGLVFSSSNSSKNYYFEEFEVFPLVRDTYGQIIYPGTVPEIDARDTYYFYQPSSKALNAEDIVFEYVGTSQFGNESNPFLPWYSETFDKVTSITISESNRFNIIQTLCETFECWAKFQIHHEPDGHITTIYGPFKRLITKTERKNGPKSTVIYYVYDKTQMEYLPISALTKFDPMVNYYVEVTMPRQYKTITFKEFIGKDNYAGFKYGINLSNIVRNINSDQLVTKLIVKQNSNEQGKDGYCDIQRASANLEGTSFILNLDYYVNQGLIDYNLFNQDLYAPAGNVQGYIAYYTRLKQINKDIATIINSQASILTTIDRLTSSSQGYRIAANSAADLIIEQQNLLKNNTQVKYEDFMSINVLDPSKRQEMVASDEVKKILTQIFTLQSDFTVNDTYATRDEANLAAYQALLDNYETTLNEKTAEKEQLDKEFYHKYSRYIQEGSWINEDYCDDNYYYFDAQNVLHTSSRPEIKYTINVIDVSPLEELSNYNFAIGDKTYIEDTEFFGWTTINGIKTPYKEEIVVSEVKRYLDNPSNNTITVQNYKTQFEDLFQRITATTQSLQYASGGYGRAAAIVNDNGTLDAEVLQNSLINNSLVLYNASDQSVTIDDKGITVENLSNPAQLLRLVSGGIMLSNDGGMNWSTGITPGGINAAFITGKLDTSQVTITSADGRPSIIWNSEGLTAYSHHLSETENGYVVDYFNYDTYIRLDQYGMYGIMDYPDAAVHTFTPLTISDIENTAEFGLTWNGFFLKSSHKEEGDGLIKISTRDDIQLLTKDDNDDLIERIKIGYLGRINSTDIYGLNIRDDSGSTVMRTGSNGELFLTKYLRIGPDVINAYEDRVQLGIVTSYIYDSETKESTITTNPAEADYSKILSIKGSSTEIDVVDLDTGENLAIYDDGTIRANNAIISGIINATGGVFENVQIIGTDTRIGDLYIEDITGTISEYNGTYGVDGYLRLTIDQIQQGVDNNTLTFNKDGLTLHTYHPIEVTSETFDGLKSALFIIEPDREIYIPLPNDAEFDDEETYFIATSVFYVDSTGQLHITGNLDAASGSFVGNVSASSGDIGGITISNGTLSAGGTNGFIINSDGSIVANNITLGDKITITNGIEFTDTNGEWTTGIYNPNENRDQFIEIKDANGVNKISVDANGNMRIGNLSFDGTNNIIKTLNYSDTGSGGGWYLGEDKSIFNNITARGTLAATTFSYGEVQAVGGSMFVRPSANILEATIDAVERKVYLVISSNDISTFIDRSGEDQYAIIGEPSLRSKIYTFTVDEANNKLILVPINGQPVNETLTDKLIGCPVISLGIAGSTGIGINSSFNDSFLPSKAVSVLTTEVETINNALSVTMKPRVLIGEIPREEVYGPQLQGTYGLYASNVYVHGAIVAKAETSKFNCAGLNTTSTVSWPAEAGDNASIWFPDAAEQGSIGKIILWAGAENESAEAISAANFKVDTYGNMYANSGYFEGTVITKATITASELRTTTITGWDDDQIGTKYAALTIKDAVYGIDFKRNVGSIENPNYETIFSVTDEAVLLNAIPLDAEYVFLHRPDGNNNRSTYIKENELSFVSNETYALSEDLVRLSTLTYTTDWFYNSVNYGSLKIGQNLNRFFFSFGNIPNSGIRNADTTTALENKSLLRLSVDNDFVLGEVSNNSSSADYGREVLYYQKALDSSSNIKGYNLFILKE